MGLFGFLKKKDDNSGSQPAAGSAGNQAAMQQNKFQQAGTKSTKVDDGKGSFEIPDFSEDDLNFDLGLNEFMQPQSESDKAMKVPQSQTKPLPKGQLKNDEDSTDKKNKKDEDPFEGMVINTKELNTDELQVGKDKVSGDQLKGMGMGQEKQDVLGSTPDAQSKQMSWGNLNKKTDSAEKPEQKNSQTPDQQEKFKDNYNKEDLSKPDELTTDDHFDDFDEKPDFNINDLDALKEKPEEKTKQQQKQPQKQNTTKKDELPKFDTKPSLDLERERAKKAQTFGDYLKKDAKKRSTPKQEAPSFEEIKKQSYALPNEIDKAGDIFIDKKKYKNMIIVADLIKEEIETAQDLDLKLIQASQEQEDNYEEMREKLEFIKETLLQIDTKIFEEGDQ